MRRLLQEPSEEESLRRRATHFGDRVDERDLFRTNFDAVLRLAAIFDAAVPHDRFEALTGVHRARRVRVEVTHEAERERSDELLFRTVLRTSFEAATARHAARQRVALFLFLLALARP